MTVNLASYIDSKDIYVKFNGANISASVVGSSFCSEWKINEVTTYGSVGARYAPSIDISTFTLDLLFNQTTTTGTQTVVGAAHIAKSLCPFEVGPAGTGSGNANISGNAWVPKYDIIGKAGSAQMVKAEFKVDNGVTVTTY